MLCRRHFATHLEVEVVDGCVSPKRVIAHAKIGVVSLTRKVQGLHEGGGSHGLGEGVQCVRHQQHVAVLNGAHVDEHL